MRVWVIVLLVLLLLAALALAGRQAPAFHGGSEHVMLPAGKPPHMHLVSLDSTGSGVSTEDESHRHQVSLGVDVKVLPAEGTQAHPHVHKISDFIVKKK